MPLHIVKSTIREWIPRKGNSSVVIADLTRNPLTGEAKRSSGLCIFYAFRRKIEIKSHP